MLLSPHSPSRGANNHLSTMSVEDLRRATVCSLLPQKGVKSPPSKDHPTMCMNSRGIISFSSDT